MNYFCIISLLSNNFIKREIEIFYRAVISWKSVLRIVRLERLRLELGLVNFSCFLFILKVDLKRKKKKHNRCDFSCYRLHTVFHLRICSTLIENTASCFVISQVAYPERAGGRNFGIIKCSRKNTFSGKIYLVWLKEESIIGLLLTIRVLLVNLFKKTLKFIPIFTWPWPARQMKTGRNKFYIFDGIFRKD